MAQTPPIRRVAVVLFEGFTVLDVYGPVQAFASCRVPTDDGKFQRLFEIFSLAEQAGPIKSGEGTVAKARGSAHQFVTREFTNRPGGIILMPEDAAQALPILPFQSYYGWLSRAPTRLSPALPRGPRTQDDTEGP